MSDLERLVAHVDPGARVLGVRSLRGGVSASVTEVEVVRSSGAVARWVVRRPRAHDWKPGASGVDVEYALLCALHAVGLPVPSPITPYDGALVSDFVEGGTELPAGAAAPLADVLAAIHAVDVATLPPLPPREDPIPDLRAAWPDLDLDGWAAGAPRLLHGDYWPGNVLWRDGQIAAVLDWEDAAVGDPLSDVACARVELACTGDPTLVDVFTERYLARTALDVRSLAVWDLYVATAALASMDQWGLDADTLARRRAATEAFAQAARNALAPSP